MNKLFLAIEIPFFIVLLVECMRGNVPVWYLLILIALIAKNLYAIKLKEDQHDTNVAKPQISQRTLQPKNTLKPRVPVTMYKLSEIKTGYGDWSKTRIDEAEKEQLKELALQFFAPLEQVLAVPSASREDDCLTAICRIKEYLENIPDSVFPFEGKNVQLKDGKIKYLQNEHEVSCYDGGNCGTDTEREYVLIRLIPDSELSGEIKSAACGEPSDSAEIKKRLIYKWGFCGELPFPDCDVFSKRGLCLIRPFGLQCSLGLQGSMY